MNGGMDGKQQSGYDWKISFEQELTEENLSFFRGSNKYHLPWLSVKCGAPIIFLIQGSMFNPKFQTIDVGRCNILSKISFFWIQDESHQSFSYLNFRNDGVRRLGLPKGKQSHYWNSSWLHLTTSADVNQLNDSSTSIT